jgi:hypothetical protein
VYAKVGTPIKTTISNAIRDSAREFRQLVFLIRVISALTFFFSFRYSRKRRLNLKLCDYSACTDFSFNDFCVSQGCFYRQLGDVTKKGFETNKQFFDLRVVPALGVAPKFDRAR